MAGAPKRVTIVEVGPRDGLQNEPGVIPTAAKIAFIDALSDAGFSIIEATSFVNPAAVPQLADADEVMRSIRRRPGTRYPVLVPNERGYDRAIAAGVDAIALFTAATEAFAQANIRCSIDDSFLRFAPVIERARNAGAWIRGYVSVAFDCPYSGKVEPAAAVSVAERLFDAGCTEVSIADTLGTANADQVGAMLSEVRVRLPLEHLAFHFHDTYGNAVFNIEQAYDQGVRIFDSSAGGLGGCPFAPGASGNVATEAVVEVMERRGIETGIDVPSVKRAVEAVLSARVPDATADS